MRIIINSSFMSIGIPILSNDILAVDVSKQHCCDKCPSKENLKEYLYDSLDFDSD